MNLRERIPAKVKERYAVLDFLVTENQIFELVHGLFTNKPPPLQCETDCNS